MKMNTYQQKILELAVEDVYGLWEILWRLQSEFPNSSTADLRQTAESALRGLLRKGWISVGRRSGGAGETAPLRPAETEAALVDRKNWDEPALDARQVVVGATAEGERIYYGDQLGVSTEEGRS